jgi:ABC-type antimicrobial peptide transport system permease subunit
MNNTQFKTTGHVEPVYDEDGIVKAYYVGRKDRGRIYLSRLIEEYMVAGNTVAIDRWGSPWVKK